jgi:hypothetical protein
MLVLKSDNSMAVETDVAKDEKMVVKMAVLLVGLTAVKKAYDLVA